MSTPQPKNPENAFIDDCQIYLDEFEDYGLHPFDQNHLRYLGSAVWMDSNCYEATLNDWTEPFQTFIIQTLLSRTPEGQAILPFLDVDTEWELFTNTPEIKYKKLDRFMYEQFTEALRVGKGFNLALQHINQIYIDHIYV